MTVLPAFETQTQRTVLPEWVIVRTEPTEDFSDYVRDAIDRSRDSSRDNDREPRTADRSDRDGDTRPIRESERDRRPHRAEERPHDESRDRSVAEDDRPASAESRNKAEHDRAPASAASDDTGTPAGTEDKTAARTEDAETGPANTTKHKNDGTKTVAAAPIGALIGQDIAAVKDNGGKTKAPAGKIDADADSDGKTMTKPNTDAAAGKIAGNIPADPAKAAGTDANGPMEPKATATATAAAKANDASAVAQLSSILADESGTDNRPARGKDTAFGQTVAAAKKTQETVTGPLAKADGDGQAPGNGQGNAKGDGAGDAKANTQAMAGQTTGADKAIKAAPPAFTGVLPTGTDMPGHATPAGDPAPITGLTQAGISHDTLALAAKAAVHKASAGAQTPAGEQVAVRIASAIHQGVDRISIQLEPRDLGRVDVKLDLHHDGRVTATVTADRQDTLDLLQRDSRSLERALQQAGLQANSDSLNFNLRGGGQDRQQAGDDGASATAGLNTAEGDDETFADPAAYRTLTSNSALDIRV